MIEETQTSSKEQNLNNINPNTCSIAQQIVDIKQILMYRAMQHDQMTIYYNTVVSMLPTVMTQEQTKAFHAILNDPHFR